MRTKDAFDNVPEARFITFAQKRAHRSRDAIHRNIFKNTWSRPCGSAIEKRLPDVLFFALFFSFFSITCLFFHRAAPMTRFHRPGETSRGCVRRAKLPKKRRKLDCLYYSPLTFDKYGCKCKTGSGSARPETRFIHIHPARACIGVTYLAKFLPSRQSHSINSERTYLAWVRMERARAYGAYRVRLSSLANI